MMASAVIAPSTTSFATYRTLPPMQSCPLLPPKETFAGDLLRVIIPLTRFASHLDFTIVPEGKEDMKLPEIKEHNPSWVLT